MIGKWIENVHMAVDALFGNKMRSILTMLGITIGVASVILLMSVGQAVEKFVIHEFSSFGSNLVMIFGKASNEVAEQMTADQMEIFVPLTENDLKALQNPYNVPDASVVAAALGVNEPMYYNNETYYPDIAGITPNYIDAYNFEVGAGEGLTWEHVESAARVAVVGVTVVEDVFDNRYPLGETIRIGSTNFTIIGVWEPIDSAIDPNSDNIVIVPISTAQRHLTRERTADGSYPIMSISIKARDETVVDDVVEQVRATLRDERELEGTDRDDFVVFSQNTMIDTLETVTGLLTVFLAVIASISLLVGGIGIMNIMLVTVTERTREIGIRKAVGAQRIDILIQFLIESITLSLVGGTIGTIIAVALSFATSAAMPSLDVQVQISSIVLAAGISIAIGTFFGAYPANRAASLNPIDALHYE